MSRTGMRLTVVGCSGSFPGPDSPASCYLVEANDGERTWRILLDLGNGAFGVLQRFVDPITVDAILFSHLHPDHYFDIAGMYVVWKYHPDGPRPRIPVWGPTGVADQVARAYGLPLQPGMHHEFEFHDYDDGGTAFRIGPVAVSTVRMAHPVPTYGLRLEHGGKVLAYSGDTGPSPAVSELARSGDLFLCEAAFLESGDNPADLHLTGKQAGAAASDAGAGRLVLTHVPPWHQPETVLAEAAESFGGPAQLAATGAVYDL